MRFVSGLGLLFLALASAARAQEPYEIGAGDTVRVSVTGQPDMSGEFAVDSSGMLVLPVLGRVKAAGMTPKALEKKLVTLLADGYLKRPEVSVVVKEFRSQRVYVTGEVGKPGPYPLKGDHSILSLLGDVGSLQQQDIGHEVIVIRPPEADAADVPQLTQPTGTLPNEVPGSQVFRLNLKELLSGNPAKNMELLPGDTVYFPKAANVYVLGHVAKPGAIRYQEGMTVFQALTLAGGVTEKGSQKAKVLSMVDGKQVEVKNLKMTDLLQPEDTIKVPERFF
jgi:polysaccharide export outer membrane protein